MWWCRISDRRPSWPNCLKDSPPILIQGVGGLTASATPVQDFGQQQYSDRCVFVRGPPELVPQTTQRVKGAHPKDHNTNFDQHTFDQKIVLCKMCFSKKHNNVCQSYSLNIPKCLPKRPQHILQKSWRPAQKKHTRLARGCISTFGLDGHGDLPA